MKKISKQLTITVSLAFCSLCAYAFLQYTYAREKQVAEVQNEKLPAENLEYDEMEEINIPDIRIIKQVVDVARGFWPVS